MAEAEDQEGRPRPGHHGPGQGPAGQGHQAYPETDKVIVEGVNRVKKHTKVGQTARGAKTGGIVTLEAPIHVSNVMLVVEPEGKKAVTRVGYRREEQERTLPDGSKKTVTRSVRYAKKTGEDDLMTVTRLETSDRPRSPPRLQGAVPGRDRPGAARGVRATRTSCRSRA